jgi:hypothetical protein
LQHIHPLLSKKKLNFETHVPFQKHRAKFVFEKKNYSDRLKKEKNMKFSKEEEELFETLDHFHRRKQINWKSSYSCASKRLTGSKV